MAGKPTVRLTNESAWTRIPRATIVAVVRGAFARHGGGAAAALNVLVVDDARIATLNRRYKRHDGPTDVLAFPDGDTDPRTGAVQWGDIMVSADTAAREADRRRGARPDWTARHELALYVLHGTLHLLGFDDADADSAETMRTEQASIFAEAALPEPPG